MIKHVLSSSMEVIRATDIGVGDRRLVRDAGARFAIETILENGMQRRCCMDQTIVASRPYP